MLILKRLTVWLVETSMEALLLGLVLTGLFGYTQHAFGRSLGLYTSGILLMSITTGYLFTTAIARGAWKGRGAWYSVIATALFLMHSEIFFVVSGGATRSEQLKMQSAGCAIVLVCTFVGSFVLRRWTLMQSTL